MATLITPSRLFSNSSYPCAIRLRGYVCVIKGSVLILPCAINFKVFSQSQPSTPPVLKVRFFPCREVVKLVVRHIKLRLSQLHLLLHIAMQAEK